MSDTTTLSHEYETSASFAESVNQAVLRLKKARLGRRDVTPEDVREARDRLRTLLDAVATSVGAAERGGTGVTVPTEVLDRLVARHSNQLAYFYEDLIHTAEALKGSEVLEEETLKVLEEICDAADATASASFRRLRRR